VFVLFEPKAGTVRLTETVDTSSCSLLIACVLACQCDLVTFLQGIF